MTASPVDASAVGERIEVLLEASSAAGPLARERSEELLRLVVELYGAGLERLLEIAYDAGKLDDDLLEALAGDELVASLLLVHDLHPYGVEERLAKALRPHDATLVSVSDGVATVRMPMGGGCGAKSAAVAVEEAVLAAAPEVVAVHVQSEAAAGLIPVDSLTSRLRTAAPA